MIDNLIFTRHNNIYNRRLSYILIPTRSSRSKLDASEVVVFVVMSAAM